MSGFEPRIFGVGSNRSANCATTTAVQELTAVDLSGFTSIDPSMAAFKARATKDEVSFLRSLFQFPFSP